MLTPHETIGVALDQLTQGLLPFFTSELQAAYGDHWRSMVKGQSRHERMPQVPDEQAWDSQAILAVMWDHWNAVFRQQLGLFERSLVSELREFRNLWAHQADLTEDDAYRVVDSVQRLLVATHSAAHRSQELERLKFDLLRTKLARQVNDDLLRARSNRERLIEIGLYGIAAAAIVLTSTVVMIPRNPLAGVILCTFTLLVFGYIMARRWNVNQPVHGVHECPKCRKIIYSEVCPYCEAPPSATAVRAPVAPRSSIPREVTTAGH